MSITVIPNQGHIQDFATITRERRLPRPGEMRVRAGQPVNALDLLARATVPQNHYIIDVAQILNVDPAQLERYVLKQRGEQVEEDEPVAARRAMAGMRRFLVRSPVDGTVVEIGNGIILIEGQPDQISLYAGMPGTVVDLLAPWGVVIEGEGARIQLAWAYGDMAYSELKILTPGDDGTLDPESLNDIDHRGTIVATGRTLTEPILRAAEETGVEAIIAASMDSTLIPLVKDELNLAIGLTEGFGAMPMPPEMGSMFQERRGHQIAFDSGYVGRWRLSPPEIIIPMPGSNTPAQSTNPPDERPDVGMRVRVLRGPDKGRIGTIASLPTRPDRLPTGLRVKGANVALSGGSEVFVPFANLEHLG